MNFSVFREPPPNRRNRCDGDQECHMTEPAIMIAFAAHLLSKGAIEVAIHPDGEHGRIFDIKSCLETNGFNLIENIGSTSYGGMYQKGKERIKVTLTPGIGDVESHIGGQKLIAECKGGIINTRHSGQTSRLRRGLCEAIGLLMARASNGERQVAVVPMTPITTLMAQRMLPRIKTVGIEIALVAENGQIEFVK